MERISATIAYLYRQSFVRYLLVGGTTFIIDLGLLLVLHEKLGVHLVIATSVAYWAAVFYNFSLSRAWTFGSSEQKRIYKNAIPYACLLGINYLFTVTFVGTASHVVPLGVAKTLAVALQTSWTYFAYKHVIFAQPSISNSLDN